MHRPSRSRSVSLLCVVRPLDGVAFPYVFVATAFLSTLFSIMEDQLKVKNCYSNYNSNSEVL